jgi:tRNA(Ile)-lysidine synthase
VALPEVVAAAMFQLLPNWLSTPGIVAVSGGADSVALLAALNTFHPPGQLVVAHLNHQLRGLESDADEQFVRELAEKMQLPCRVLRMDIAQAATGENLEAFARDARYRWFGELAAEVGAGWIATGHHADDQAGLPPFAEMESHLSFAHC